MAKRKPKFKVRQIVIAAVNEGTCSRGEPWRVAGNEYGESCRNKHEFLVEVRGAKGARHWFFEDEVRNQTKREKGER